MKIKIKEQLNPGDEISVKSNENGTIEYKKLPKENPRKVRREWWFNVYESYNAGLHDTRKSADDAETGRKECVHVRECFPGDKIVKKITREIIGAAWNNKIYGKCIKQTYGNSMIFYDFIQELEKQLGREIK